MNECKRNLVENGVNYLRSHVKHYTLEHLHIACQCGLLDVAKEVCQEVRPDRRSLYLCCANNNVEILRYLLESLQKDRVDNMEELCSVPIKYANKNNKKLLEVINMFV